MKVLVGQFMTESNAHIPYKNDITAYDIAFGSEAINKMQIRDVFDKNDIDIIPSIYANAGASGVIKKNAFLYIESCIIDVVKEHLDEIDGIYLMLHGASEVEGIGSGDHHILASIREITGEYMPIAIACDPHGNLCQRYVEQSTIIRSYRESPHTDQEATWKKVAEMLCELLKNRQQIKPVYRKLPLILGGEQSVSSDEPVFSINRYLDTLEQDEKIRSCSWHVGYIRHDTDKAGCGIVVIPTSKDDQEYAEIKADELANFVWNKRHEFHYTGRTAKPKEALEMVLNTNEKNAVLTDSGDNMTSGATGWNTYVLRQVLNLHKIKKSFLFAPICDPHAYRQLCNLNEGEEVEINIGVGYDELSEPVHTTIVIKKHKEICEFIGEEKDKVMGRCVLVSIKDTPIDIIISDTNSSITNEKQFKYMDVDWTSYDITVLKQGYIFPDFKEKAGFYVMSLTDGATPQNTASIPFKRILRPMYPIDEI